MRTFQNENRTGEHTILKDANVYAENTKKEVHKKLRLSGGQRVDWVQNSTRQQTKLSGLEWRESPRLREAP